ncbi:hypothetical protein JCM5296_002938 [Sporobolomyces johnsonii]
MSDPDWDSAFGSLEPEIDDSAATARAARIAAARTAALEYSAKIEEPGWFNDPLQSTRSKSAGRPALYALHGRYFRREWDEVVRGGLGLLEDGVKEEGEVRDLVMRAAVRAGREADGRVRALARRWSEYPNQPSLCHISARILFAASQLQSASSPSSSPPDRDSPATTALIMLQHESLHASLASLRLNRLQPPFLSTLRAILVPSHPLLAQVLDDRAVLQENGKREQVVKEVDSLELEARERETLERVLGLWGDGDEPDEEDVGRDVRSL